jgi:hypothetical protein
MVLLVLKLFVSSRPLKLEGVLCIYVCYFMKDKLKTTCYVFPYDLSTHLTFNVSLFMIFRLCFVSSYNMVAKFYCQDYVFHGHVLSSLIPALNALHRFKIVMVHVT